MSTITHVPAARFMADFNADVIVPAQASDQMLNLLADRFIVQAAQLDLKVTRPDMMAHLVTLRAMEREAVQEMDAEALVS